MTILVTGGAGFIGSNFIIEWFKLNDEPVINLDSLTYAAGGENLSGLGIDKYPYTFVKGTIADSNLVLKLLKHHKVRAVINFAAESHVDRSINDPEIFLQTNVLGTYRLLSAALDYWKEGASKDFVFLHISTDEVYGDLDAVSDPFTESNAFRPNSPYAASKASSDHIARAFYQTYGLPVITSNCSNNYGPYQFPEKLIPLIINNALEDKQITVYGDGNQIRDWLYVTDHCSALMNILEAGTAGQTYNVGGNNEVKNIDVVRAICSELDNIIGRPDKKSYFELVCHIKDRPGHDRRYAVDSSKLQQELGWLPVETFSTGLSKTIKWYLDNADWLKESKKGNYDQWIEKQYGNSNLK